MKLAEGMGKVVLMGALAAGLLLCGKAANAQSADVTGEYECTEAKVAGKSLPCKAAQLSLKSDGRFELQGREGQYMVAGSWGEMTGAVMKSRAKIEAGHKIVFRFDNKKECAEMTYERQLAGIGSTSHVPR